MSIVYPEHFLATNFTSQPEESSAIVPPKGMKNAFCPSTALDGSVALSFVIPERSRGVCISTDLAWKTESRPATELSSRPERSGVERSAVSFWVSHTPALAPALSISVASTEKHGRTFYAPTRYIFPAKPALPRDNLAPQPSWLVAALRGAPTTGNGGPHETKSPCSADLADGHLNASFGLYSGIAFFAIPQVLATHHVTEARIAAITAMALSPNFWAVIFGPMLGCTLQPPLVRYVFRCSGSCPGLHRSHEPGPSCCTGSSSGSGFLLRHTVNDSAWRMALLCVPQSRRKQTQRVV